MALYCITLTVPAKGRATETVEVEANFVSSIEVRFPPGPSGLLGVRVLYGAEQIFPKPAQSFVWGDDETVYDDTIWETPAPRCTLTVEGVNLDDTYPHTAYVRILTKKYSEEPVSRLAKALAGAR
jgi:hypothetical protein